MSCVIRQQMRKHKCKFNIVIVILATNLARPAEKSQLIKCIRMDSILLLIVFIYHRVANVKIVK